MDRGTEDPDYGLGFPLVFMRFILGRGREFPRRITDI